MNTNYKLNINRKVQVSLLLICAFVLSMMTAFAQFVPFNWTGAAGDSILANTNNWSSPVTLTTNRPNANFGDDLHFDGTVPGALLITNGPGNAAFDANPGLGFYLDAGQTSPVTIIQSNTFGGRIRFRTNMIVASSAGALTFGNGGSTPFPLALGIGNGTIHRFTNNAAFPVTFNTETYWLMGGGGSHTLILGGTGDWDLETKYQPQNSANLVLNVSGSGTVTYKAASAPSTAYAGAYGQLILTSGTLRLSLVDPQAIGSGNTFTIAGGTLDNTVPGQTFVNNNPIQWNGDWSFIGQNLNMGFGTITMAANRIVTVSSNTLTINGVVTGAGRLTKAGAGTMVLNSGLVNYTGGTIVSNGVLQLTQPGDFPTGTSAAESLSTFGAGTLDVNGLSLTVSTFNGSGNVDTSSGTPTLTIGDFNGGGSFSGSIKNTGGTLSLVKTGTGIMTFSGASTYSGGTTVSGGGLVIANTTGSATGSGSVTVASGANFGGSGSVAGPVTWQSGSAAQFIATNGNMPLAVSGTVALNNNPVTVNVQGAAPLGAGDYILMTYTQAGSSGSFNSHPSFTGAGVDPTTKQIITNGSGAVHLVVIPTTAVVGVWTNDADGNWSVPANWLSNTVPKLAGQFAQFGTVTKYTTVTLDLAVSNAAVVFSNTNSFSIADGGFPLALDNTNAGATIVVSSGNSNSIGTAVSLHDTLTVAVFPGTSLAISNTISSPSSRQLIMNGAGTLGLYGNNTYGPSAGSIGTVLDNNGVLVLGNNNAMGAGDVYVFQNATVRAATTLSLANNVTLSNTVTASLDTAGNNVTLSGVISGAGGLTKNGSGAVNLNNANTYAANTAINSGTAKLGNASGIPGGVGFGDLFLGTNAILDLNGFSPILNTLVNNAGGAIVDNTAGGSVTLTVGESGGFGTFGGTIKNSSGTLALVKDGAGQETLTGTNTYSGGTTVNAGILQMGNGNVNPGTTGIAASVGAGDINIASAGTFAINLAGTNVFTNTITGSGLLTVNNITNKVFLTANNSGFTGNITVNSGALWITNVNQVGPGPKLITAVASGNSIQSEIHLAGAAAPISFDPSITFQLTYLNGVLFNESGSNALNGAITLPFGGGNTYIKVNGGFLNIASPVSSDGVASGRNFQLGGAGNGSFTGSIFDTNGLGVNLTKVDAGTWTVTGTNTTQGTLNANAGRLILSGQWANGPANIAGGGTLLGTGLSSNLTVAAGGIFVPGAYGSVGTFTVSNLFTLAGTMYVSLNKSLPQSNSLVNIQVNGLTNIVANTGSSIVVSNLGPALVGGDAFYVFNQAVTNGNLVLITGNPGTGLMFTNMLAVDGSIRVLQTVALNPTNILMSVSSGLMTLSWPSDHLGWTLQAQTNSATTGIGTNWFDVPNSATSTQSVITINRTNPTVFYRLRF